MNQAAASRSRARSDYRILKRTSVDEHRESVVDSACRECLGFDGRHNGAGGVVGPTTAYMEASHLMVPGVDHVLFASAEFVNLAVKVVVARHRMSFVRCPSLGPKESKQRLRGSSDGSVADIARHDHSAAGGNRVVDALRVAGNVVSAHGFSLANVARVLTQQWTAIVSRHKLGFAN